MKNLLRLEELAQFLACLCYIIATDGSWWVYGLLLVGPDVSMLGYLISSTIGAGLYNAFHHKALALAFIMLGLLLMSGWVITVGAILYGHASMDRIFGYGLKFNDSFHHTHLGWIGKGRAPST